MRIAVFLAILVLGLATNASKAIHAADDYKKLHGKWIGTEAGSADTDTVVFEFDGKEFQFSNRKTGESFKGKFVLNEGETPKQMVGTITECSVKEVIGKDSNGIYEASEDSLTLAARAPGQPGFPKDFQDEESRVFSLTRAKSRSHVPILKGTRQPIR